MVQNVFSGYFQVTLLEESCLLQVAFEDVFGEPDGAHSPDCAWKCGFKCYEGGKNCCYKCITVCCTWLFGLCWGCEFACLTFYHIWYITPTMRCIEILCLSTQKIFSMVIACFVTPCMSALGMVFSNIKVTQG